MTNDIVLFLIELAKIPEPMRREIYVGGRSSLARLARELGYLDDNNLTDKGVWFVNTHTYKGVDRT